MQWTLSLTMIQMACEPILSYSSFLCGHGYSRQESCMLAAALHGVPPCPCANEGCNCVGAFCRMPVQGSLSIGLSGWLTKPPFIAHLASPNLRQGVHTCFRAPCYTHARACCPAKGCAEVSSVRHHSPWLCYSIWIEITNHV